MNVGRTNKDGQLNDVFCAYQIDFKKPNSMSRYQFVFDKSCHQLVELEHQELWALINMDWKKTSKSRLEQIQELEEFHYWVYERLVL